MIVLSVVALFALREWRRHSHEMLSVESTSNRLADLFTRRLHGGLGGFPVTFESVRTVQAGDATVVSAFEMTTSVGFGLVLAKSANRSGPRHDLLRAMGVKDRFTIKGRDQEVMILTRLSQALVDALIAATEEGLWSEVFTIADERLVFAWRSESVTPWGELDALVDALVDAACEVIGHTHPDMTPAELLRERARSRTEAPEIRWRSARALLTSFPDSDAAARIVSELDELHEHAQAACVIWAANPPLPALACYSLLRRVAVNAPSELKDAAATHIKEHLAWTCLVDRKTDPKLLRVIASRALVSSDAPLSEGQRDAALVELFRDSRVDDLELGELYEVLMGSGWAPGSAIRRGIASTAGRWVREAMIEEVAARGPVFEDRDALVELMKAGGHERIAPLLDVLRRAGHLGAGQLTVTDTPEHQGGLSQVGQRGELTEAEGARARGGLTDADGV